MDHQLKHRNSDVDTEANAQNKLKKTCHKRRGVKKSRNE